MDEDLAGIEQYREDEHYGFAVVRDLVDTGRTALFADGHSERIFETWVETGMFAGCTHELTESELTDAEKHEVLMQQRTDTYRRWRF